MFWIFFPKCLLINGLWVVNILKCHLVLGSRHIFNIFFGTFKCIFYRHSRWYCLVWMPGFSFMLINSVTARKESFLQSRSSSPTKKHPTFNHGNVCNKKQKWSENKLQICLISAFTPSWGRHTSTHCQLPLDKCLVLGLAYHNCIAALP